MINRSRLDTGKYRSQKLFRAHYRNPLTPSFYNAQHNTAPDENELKYYIKHSDDFIQSIQPFNQKDNKPKGIVTCGGGVTYFTCAYIMVRMLRSWGCTLPVELWYLGSKEMTQEMIDIISPYGVVCIDAYKVRKEFPAKTLNGWELKPYAILHSKFDEVFFIDADNVPLINLEIFFNDAEYKTKGSLFWPDQGRLSEQRPIWKICNVQYRDEPEFETGQIVIDKSRCWRELNLTKHFNDNSDYYYRFMWGDKETFHMAWNRLNTPFGIIPHPLKRIDINGNWVTFCQHDMQGNRVLQHRNTLKWSFSGHNNSIPDFIEEARCFKYLEELRYKWSGSIPSVVDDSPESKLVNHLQTKQDLSIDYFYPQGSHSAKAIFGANGSMFDSLGFTAKWFVENDGVGTVLKLLDGWHRVITTFRPEGDSLVARDYRNEIKSVIY